MCIFQGNWQADVVSSAALLVFFLNIAHSALTDDLEANIQCDRSITAITS